MENKMISIIVPIYNTEKYIERCINSIRNQTYSNIEIILVNDGSTDRSLEICNEMAARDKRIVVLSQVNSGVSVARNNGLSFAHGEYIAFVDSDDYIKENMYKELIELMERKEVDLICCGCFHVNETNILVSPQNKEEIFVDKDEGIYKILDRNGEYDGYIINKIFKKKIIDKWNITFNPLITISEDTLFCIEYLIHVEYCYFTSKPYYYYDHCSGGVMNSKKNGEEIIRNNSACKKNISVIEARKQIISLLEKENSINNINLSKGLYEATVCELLYILYTRKLDEKVKSESCTYVRSCKRYKKEIFVTRGVNLFGDKIKAVCVYLGPCACNVYRKIFNK
jgi:glycosyltransferase involved in cell wall biosynthesis